MAREIPLDQIGDYYRENIRILVAATTLEAEKRLKEKTPVFSKSNYSQAELDEMPEFFKVNGKTVPLKKSIDEHLGGRLRNAWQSDPAKGEVTNNMEYAEPVLFGPNLPPSWKGQFRTRQNTVPGFPDLIAKELESWAQREYNKIANR